MAFAKRLSHSKIIAGNWKMYKTAEEAKAFVERLTPLILESQARVLLAVPFTAITSVADLVVSLGSSIEIGAQNMHDASEGAFTGEIAASMLKEAGARFVLLGHSERRHLFHETSQFINKKVKRALQEDLQPILCIGETAEERAAGKTEDVLKMQLQESLDGIAAKDISKIIFAYEPVWAIGTGNVASPEDAEQAHQFCRSCLSEIAGKNEAESLFILYGGSVKPDNAKALLARPGIDGLLVGGSSLSPETFSQIVNAYTGGS